jgi:hypothetical protein
MPLTKDEIQEIAVRTADEVVNQLRDAEENIATRDIFIGMVIGEGAIPVHGRETRKAPCQGCRIDPEGPLEAGNVMVTTEDAIGTLSQDEVREWCSEIIETPDGRCTRARNVRQAAQACKALYPDDSQKYFECFIPKFRAVTTKV